MAKEVAGLIKLQIKGGAANPSPPVGPALGSKGINIMGFCKEFNARTQDKAADVVFMNSNMDAIPQAIALANKTGAVAMQNVIFAIGIKVIVMILGLTGIYTNMWLAVFADTGVAFLCILNSIRILRQK